MTVSFAMLDAMLIGMLVMHLIAGLDELDYHLSED